jgi:triacylglycerol lipase
MNTFDRAFARLLLEVCRYTYAAAFNDTHNAAAKQDALGYITKLGGLATPEPILLRGGLTSVASVAAYPDRNVVAYMGTKTQFDTLDNVQASIADWQENLETLQVPFSLGEDQLGAGHPAGINPLDLGGLVHRGFLAELKLVQAQVVAELLKRGGRGRPVYVTGHSQGGAEAVLATRALLAGGFPVAGTYTFAAPRVGDGVFVKSIPATLPFHRLEFGDDIVPHVPPILAGTEAKAIIKGLKLLPFLPDTARRLLDFAGAASSGNAFAVAGRLAYGSTKTLALRVGLSADEEGKLFYDRLWSLVRHPERWAEHHHLDGTAEDIRNHRKGNYTALVSEYAIVG